MKKLKNIILLLMLLSLSNCPCGIDSPPAEHLYLWDSTEDTGVFFILSTYEKNYNPSTQSLIQYIDQEQYLFGSDVFIYDDNNVAYDLKNRIKELGARGNFFDGGIFHGLLDKEFPNNIKDNPLYSSVETDKNKIAYYPMSVIARDKLAQRLYFKQDTSSDSIDVLAIDFDNDITDFQFTFTSPPEYAFVPERNNDGKPL